MSESLEFTRSQIYPQSFIAGTPVLKFKARWQTDNGISWISGK